MSYKCTVFQVVIVEELFNVESKVGVIVDRIVRGLAMVSEILNLFRRVNGL
jgi:hypothetical protein